MIPDFQSCMLPFLRKLEDGSVHSMTEIQNALIREFHLTETDVKEMLPSNRTTRFRSNVGWAKTHMQKAGLLETPQRAQYRITEAGLRLLQTRPEHINMKLLFNYPAYKEWIALSNRNSEPKRNSKQESECVIQTPDIIMEEEYKKLRNILAQDLLERILKKDPGFFEALVIKLLVAMGYGGSLNEAAGMVVGKSGDEGIDGIIKEDKLGLDNIYIQAKRRNNVVERPEVQKFVGALAGKGATKGIFITTSSFSRGAREFKPQNNIKIVLIDGNQLCEYMIDYNIGVFTANTFEVKRIDIDFFESEE